MNFIPYQAVTRREILLTAQINPATQKGIEIGALHNPIVRQLYGDVRFVDYMDTEQLRAKFINHPDWVAGMVEVDYVWSGAGSLREVIGTGELFDWVIASHVMEHVPNMLGWLRAISEILQPGGVLNLAIPDRRFTFDIRCPESTLGQLVEADLLNYRYPSIHQMFDNCYYAKAIDPGGLWREKIDVNMLPRFSGEIAVPLACAQAMRILNSGEYFDSHCWIVTPLSFLGLMEGVVELGLITLIPTAFHPTEIDEFEFFASFSRPDPRTTPDEVRTEQVSALRRMRADLEERMRRAKLFTNF